jgi:hypothetical protein
MSTAKYSRYSPYFSTRVSQGYLGLLNYRKIPAKDTDTYYEIDSFYNFRPDLLSNDLYKTSQLWWVFAVRNPNTIRDPVFDFKTGNRIYLPSLSTIEEALGI